MQSQRATDTLRAADATPTPIRSQKLQVALHPTAPKLLVARLGGAFGGFIGAVIAPLKALFAAEPVKVNDVDLLLTPLSDRMASAVYLNATWFPVRVSPV